VVGVEHRGPHAAALVVAHHEDLPHLMHEDNQTHTLHHHRAGPEGDHTQDTHTHTLVMGTPTPLSAGVGPKWEYTNSAHHHVGL
jgi:hypothetical protein